jgi:hypothetical protein
LATTSCSGQIQLAFKQAVLSVKLVSESDVPSLITVPWKAIGTPDLAYPCIPLIRRSQLCGWAMEGDHHPIWLGRLQKLIFSKSWTKEQLQIPI